MNPVSAAGDFSVHVKHLGENARAQGFGPSSLSPPLLQRSCLKEWPKVAYSSSEEC